MAGAFFLASSHPFSGCELLAVVGLWAALERLLMKSRDVPLWFIVGIGAVSLGVIGYYGVFLAHDPEHRELLQQWVDPGLVLKVWNIVPAYALVALMAVMGGRGRAAVWSNLGDPFDRLCVVWATTAFLLANHEWFMTPHQPLHFTRGYIWLPLFLLGARWLRRLFDQLWTHSVAGRAGALGLLLVLLLDNTAWLTLRTREAFGGEVGLYLSRGQRALLAEIQKLPAEQPLVVSNDPEIGYLVTIYTPLRAFVSHWANTPFVARKTNDVGHLFTTCTLPQALVDRELLVITTMGMAANCDLGVMLGKPVLQSPAGVVYYFQPHQ